MTDEIKDRESALEQQYHELLDETKRKLQAHEVTIQRLTTTLADKEQQLQVKLQKAPVTCMSALFCLIFIINSLQFVHSCAGFFSLRST